MKRMIMTAVVLLTLIPILLIGFGVNYYAQTTIQDKKVDALSSMVHMINIHLTRYYDRLINDVQMKTDDDIFLSVVETEGTVCSDPAQRSEIQKHLLAPVGFPLSEGAVINTAGKVICSTQPVEEGLILDQTKLYKTIMNGEASYIGLIAVNNASDMLEIAVPIHDDQGEIIGILKQNATLDLLWEYLNSLNLGESGYAFLIQKSGYMIFNKDKANLTILYREFQDNSSLEQLVSDLKSDRLEEEKGTIEFENNGIEYIGAYEKVRPINCIAVVAAERNEIPGNRKEINTLYFTAVIGILIITSVCGYIIGSLHTAPLKIMNDTLGKIANGDLTARCSFKRMNEFGELCRKINNLADSYQKNEKELRMSSRIDSLTHLPNRSAIYEVLDTLLYKHPNQALILIDLEGFKELNENLGYDIGDRILMEVGDILRELPQHVCYPSRLGGTEFLVFVTNWTAPKYPERIAEKIINKIEGIRFIDEIHVDIGASIGIEYIEDEKSDKKRLLKHSNIAIHKAKSIGRNSYFVHYPHQQKDL